jgi:hypothetical protein
MARVHTFNSKLGSFESLSQLVYDYAKLRISLRILIKGKEASISFYLLLAGIS